MSGSVQEAEERKLFEAPKQKRTRRPRASAAPAKELERQAPNMPEGRIKIMLEENDLIPPTGQFFGINGAAFILRPGVEASVPKGIVDILNNAEMSVPVKDPNTLQVIGWRRKLRYPYRLIG